MALRAIVRSVAPQLVGKRVLVYARVWTVYWIVCQRAGGGWKGKNGEYQQKGEADGQDLWTRLAHVIQDALNRRAGSVTTQ